MLNTHERFTRTLTKINKFNFYTKNEENKIKIYIIFFILRSMERNKKNHQK